MGSEALWNLLRGQHARLFASEVGRVTSDEVLEAERAARSELDHDLTAALAAVEGAARALELSDRRAAGSDRHALAHAIASEITRLQQLLGRDPRRSTGHGRFAVGPAIVPVITCDLALGVDIRTEVPSDLVAQGSPHATAQVVRDLLDNAHRHAPGAPVRISGRQAGAWIEIRVADGGRGVTEADRTRIFERGFRGAHAGPGGSGLGLFVAAKLMAEQGGELVLDPDHAATFRLRLPAAEVDGG
jgi:signal transduction histidine kinase